eukprot:gene27713-34476_t
MFYNVADGVERNPDIIRAEMALLNTPMNQAYAMDAYVAVKNIQDQCAIDYESFCASAPSETMTIDQFFEKIFSPRRLTSNGLAVESAGASLVNSLKSLVGTKKVESPQISKVSHVQYHENASKLKELTGKKSLRKAKRSLAQVDALASLAGVAPSAVKPNRVVKNIAAQEAVETPVTYSKAAKEVTTEEATEVQDLPGKPKVAHHGMVASEPRPILSNTNFNANSRMSGVYTGPIMKKVDGSVARVTEQPALNANAAPVVASHDADGQVVRAAGPPPFAPGPVRGPGSGPPSRVPGDNQQQPGPAAFRSAPQPQGAGPASQLFGRAPPANAPQVGGALFGRAAPPPPRGDSNGPPPPVRGQPQQGQQGDGPPPVGPGLFSSRGAPLPPRPAFSGPPPGQTVFERVTGQPPRPEGNGPPREGNGGREGNAPPRGPTNGPPAGQTMFERVTGQPPRPDANSPPPPAGPSIFSRAGGPPPRGPPVPPRPEDANKNQPPGTGGAIYYEKPKAGQQKYEGPRNQPAYYDGKKVGSGPREDIPASDASSTGTKKGYAPYHEKKVEKAEKIAEEKAEVRAEVKAEKEAEAQEATTTAASLKTVAAAPVAKTSTTKATVAAPKTVTTAPATKTFATTTTTAAAEPTVKAVPVTKTVSQKVATPSVAANTAEAPVVIPAVAVEETEEATPQRKTKKSKEEKEVEKSAKKDDKKSTKKSNTQRRDMNAVESDSESDSDSDSGSDEEVETKKKVTDHTDCNKSKTALTAGPPPRGFLPRASQNHRETIVPTSSLHITQHAAEHDQLCLVYVCGPMSEVSDGYHHILRRDNDVPLQ